jgi:hypothetical protein
VNPRHGLNVFEKGKISCPYQISKPWLLDHPSHCPVTIPTELSQLPQNNVKDQMNHCIWNKCLMTGFVYCYCTLHVWSDPLQQELLFIFLDGAKQIAGQQWLRMRLSVSYGRQVGASALGIKLSYLWYDQQIAP